MRKQIAFIALIWIWPLFSKAATSIEAWCIANPAICKCSEPMDSNDGNYGDQHNFTGSTGAKQCWGGAAGFQPFGTDGAWSSVPVPWTPGGFAQHPHGGASGWLLPEKVTSGNPLSFTSADKVQCYRYYNRVDNPYGSTGTCYRNKLFQANFQNCPAIQFQERGDSTTCYTNGTHYNFQISVPVAPIAPNGMNADFPTSIEFNPQCDDKPCRFEFCVDATNLAAGSNVQVRGKVCSLETGTCITATTPVLGNCGVPTVPDFWGGDRWHNSGVGESDLAFFVSARWQTDTDQWIGPASEVEGGAAPPPPPPPPPLICPSDPGPHCGEAVTRTAGTLYNCTLGIYSVNQVCSYGCHTTAGAVDYCEPAPCPVCPTCPPQTGCPPCPTCPPPTVCPVLIKGDCNGDGKVDWQDVICTLQVVYPAP